MILFWIVLVLLVVGLVAVTRRANTVDLESCGNGDCEFTPPTPVPAPVATPAPKKVAAKRTAKKVVRKIK